MTSMSTLPEKQPRWTYQSVGVVNVVSISSNGLYVVMGTSDGYVYLFNSSSNVPLNAVNIGSSVSVIGISYYGKYLAVASGNNLKTYNLTSGQLQFLWSFLNVPGWNNEGGVHSIAFSSDGRILTVGTWKGYYGTRSYVHIFDITNSTPLWSATITDANGNPYDYVTVDISSDGQYIVAGSTRNNKVYLFSQASSTLLYSYDTGAAVNAVSMNSNGNNFAVGGNKVYYFDKNLTVPIWTKDLGSSISSNSLKTDGSYIIASTGNSLYLLRNDNIIVWSYGLDNSIGSISISSEGEYEVVRCGYYAYMFSSDIDGEPGTPQHEPLWRFNLGTTINSVMISSDGRYVVVGGGNYLNLFDANFAPNLTPKVIQFSNGLPKDGDTVTISATINNEGNLDSPIASVRFFFDYILVGTNQVPQVLKASSINTSLSCVVSPSGNHTVKIIVDSSNMIYESNETDNMLNKNISVDSYAFIDTGANPVITDIAPAGTVRSVSISGNGYYSIAGTNDGYFYMFFRNHTSPLWSYKTSGSLDVASISEDGSYYAFAVGNTLYAFSRTSNIPLWSFLNVPGWNNQGAIYSLAFSSDGRFLVAGTWKGYYGTCSYVYLFDITSGTPLWNAIITQANGSPDDYACVDISSDGQYIVAGSTRNNKVYLFSQVSSTPLYSYDTGAAVNAVSVSADGNNFVAGSNKLYYFGKDVIVPLWSRDIGGTIGSVSISDDSMCIVATKGNYVHLIKNDNTEQWSYNATTAVNQALISADGNHIIARSGNYAHLFSRITDGNLTTSAHDPIWSYDTKNTVNTISISSDGRYAILGSGGKTFLFDVQHKADLTLTSISFSNDKPNEGETVTSYATVNNTGAYKSYYTNASFYDGTTLIGRTQIDPISPNSSTVASKTYQCVAGTRTIRILVDPDNVIYESNKTNNEFTTTIFVNSRPTPVTLYSPSEITTTTMKLTWTTSTESDFAEYQIYQSTTSGQLGSLVGTVKEKATINYVVSGLSGSTTYYFAVRVVDANGGAGDSNQVSATTLPTPVTLSSPTNPKTSSLDLAWTKNTDQSFTKYEIYRSTSQGQLGTLITSITNQAQTTYTATGLSASTTYHFTIRVVNPKNLYSDSNQVSGTTAPTPSTLSNPTNPKTTSLDLSWSRNTDQGFAKYEIYQSKTSGQIGTLIATISDQAQTTYTARSLSASTTYYFVIRTYNIQGIFSTSNQVAGTTLPTPVTLSNPSSLTQTSMHLSWTKNVDNDFSKYEIYRSTSQGQIGTLIATINNQTQIYYNVTGLTPSTTYFFVVRTANSKNLFSDSNQATGTTMAIPVPTPVTLNNPSNPTISSLYLTWSKNSDPDFLKCEIYISQSSSSRGSLIATINNQSITSYNVTGLNPSTTYYFTVRTTNQQGGYSDSNQVSNTTLGGAFPPVDLSVLLGILGVFLLVTIPALYIRHKRSQKPYASYTPPSKPKEDTVIYGKPGSGMKTSYITLSTGEIRCGNCGFVNNKNAKYCKNCGARF
jgi:hypothetical protein